MKAIFKKELSTFFSTPVGYLVIGIYLIINGLFLWVFEGDFNILHAGFADLNSYFFLAPWVFMFLIPSVTMRSFSDEVNSGTIEILKTKPISITQIVLGKYFGALVLVLISIVPTFFYVYTIYQLGNPIGNIKLGNVLGSFIGLFLLASVYTALGIFTSVLSKNQIVSFISSVFLCFFMYYGIETLGTFNLFGNLDFFIQNLGINYHYQSVGKGVIDTRDIIYFISLIIVFLTATHQKVQYEN